MALEQAYKDPVGGTASSVGSQIRTDYHVKKALIELQKEQYFSQLADVTAMPKNFGKNIKLYHYLPLLDDRNTNDQGINAAGTALVAGDGDFGNLYGSSKDIGTIPGKLPALSEAGGRVNRVGFKRVELTGGIEKFGFFDEYTQESLDFDTDGELMMHINREMLRGANEMTEDALQIDLLAGAGTIRFAGSATALAEVEVTHIVTYSDLMKLAIDLDNNRTPKHTKVISGSRMVDTKTISAARVMYVGSEMIPTLRAMVDLHGLPAFVPVQQYADGGNVLNGEIGSVDAFRIVVVPEMMKYAGQGATDATGVAHTTGGDIDVFPMLVVGDGAFTTVGFQTDGKTVKFKITHKKPGEATADRSDPYGETGFMSIKWYYGSLILRGERIAKILTAATL